MKTKQDLIFKEIAMLILILGVYFIIFCISGGFEYEQGVYNAMVSGDSPDTITIAVMAIILMVLNSAVSFADFFNLKNGPLSRTFVSIIITGEYLITGLIILASFFW